MALNEVARLKQELAAMRSNYRRDLGLFRDLAIRTGNLRTAEAAEECLKKL